jgi:hypothetical protein
MYTASFTRSRLGRILDQVAHVVHRVDELVDLVAVDRRDERLVQHAIDFMRDTVGRALGVVHVAVVLLAQVQVVVVGYQLREGTARLDNAVGVLVEQLEKIAFARQQLAKQHCWLLVGIDFGIAASVTGRASEKFGDHFMHCGI